MIYENILLEEAEDMLHCDSSILLEASGGKGGKGGHGNGQNNKPQKELGFFDKIKNGQYLPGSEKVKTMVKVGALKPYGFENVDITNTAKLKGVMASIKRRRDIEGARALVVGCIEATAAVLFGGLSVATQNAADTMAQNAGAYGTNMIDAAAGASNVFKIMSVISAALTVFTEVANMVDYVKANKAVAKVRQNVMDAYDQVSTKLMNTKTNPANQKSSQEYHAMLSYRDLLRECQLQLSNFGGAGANSYTAAMHAQQSL